VTTDPALRLSALMGLPVVYLLTHDSIAVGEDGPTHQPIEHVESLRLIPRLAVLRPADAAETVSAWHAALTRTDGPTALILTRQSVPDLGACPLDTVARHGARVVGPSPDAPQVAILATGSEVALAQAAAERLGAEGIAARAVSVPWRERFAALPPDERAAITGGAPLTFAVEAGVPSGWSALTGSGDRVLGLTDFGASGPGDAVAEHFGLTADAVVQMVRRGLDQV